MVPAVVLVQKYIVYDHQEKTLFISGEYSMLLVSFHLQRHMGNFLIQVYGPCVLLVVLSWVSFWLNREATADRVSLGLTNTKLLNPYRMFSCRYNDCTDHDISWIGGENRSSKSSISYSFGFLCISLFHFYIRDNNPIRHRALFH